MRIPLALGLASLCLAFTITACPFGGRCGGGPDHCEAGEVQRSNVDCWFCCQLGGQRCSQSTPQDQTTPTSPCCSGVCQANGTCACSSEGESCNTDGDCCFGTCVDTICKFKSCTDDSQCGAGAACVTGLAPARSEGAAFDGGACFGTPGHACENPSECLSGICGDGGACACSDRSISSGAPICEHDADCCAGTCDGGQCF
ncbi:MAG: hypothetical protein JST54_35385 [Deltaproteobacteria bacterium]|nr:hypothetical protein [Deltaproteobacteria bacterium]